MKASEFTPLGTNQKRPARSGSRPDRGHEPQKRYVTDRKTGKQYDPDEEFDKLKNSPDFQAQMKRMATKEGKEDKIAQLKKDYDTAVHWSKNDTNPHKREAARQKAEKIKNHLQTQYKQSVEEGFDDVVKGVKRKIAGKEDPEAVAQRRYMDYVAKRMTGDPHHKAGQRYDKVDQIVRKRDSVPMNDALKVLRQHGAEHFKTTSNELHFYKDGRGFSVDLVLNPDATRSVTLSSLNSATRGLKGQGVAEGNKPTNAKVAHRRLNDIINQDTLDNAVRTGKIKQSEVDKERELGYSRHDTASAFRRNHNNRITGKQGVAEGVNYPQKHSSWSVQSPKKNEFNTSYKLDQEQEARAHAERIGGKLVKVDQHGHAIRAKKGVAEGFDYTMKDLGNDYSGFPSNHSLKHKFLARIKPEKQQLYKDKMNNMHEFDQLFQLFKVAKARGDIISESASKAVASTAKRLTDPTDGKTAKLRAAGDKKREEQLKYRDTAKRVSETSDEKKAAYKAAATAQVKELKPHAEKGEYKDIAQRAIARREKGLKRVEEHFVEHFCEECGGSLAEHGKASRALCLSRKPDEDLGASNLSSCKSQGLRARDGNKSHKLGKTKKSRVKVGGHKIKGNKYGGPLPDWS